MLLRGDHPTLACKAVRVSDFSGKSLGTVGSTTLEMNPDLPEAGHLRAWYDNGGAAAPATALGQPFGGGGGGGRQDRFMNCAQIKEETAAGVPSTLWVQTRAYITHLKANNETGVLYPACPLPAEGAAQPGRTCQKKLRNDGGAWHCEKHQASVEGPDWRYMITAKAADWSGPDLWLSAFGDVVRWNDALLSMLTFS